MYLSGRFGVYQTYPEIFEKKNIHSDSLSAMKFGLGEGMRYENWF